MVLKIQKVWNEKLNVLLTVQFRIMSIYHILFFQTLHFKKKRKEKWRIPNVWDIYYAMPFSSNSSLNCWGHWAKETAPLNVSPIIHIQWAGKQPFSPNWKEWTQKHYKYLAHLLKTKRKNNKENPTGSHPASKNDPYKLSLWSKWARMPSRERFLYWEGVFVWKNSLEDSILFN